MASNRPAKVHGITMIREDEYEVFSTHASIAPILLRGIPLLLLAAAAAIGVHVWKQDAGLTATVAGIAVAVVVLSRMPRCIGVLAEPIVVSNRRLYLRKGIIDIDDHIASLANISDIRVDPTIVGRILGYADVTIQTIAGEQDFEMREVSRAYDLRDHILRISDESVDGQQQQQQYAQSSQAGAWQQRDGRQARRDGRDRGGRGRR